MDLLNKTYDNIIKFKWRAQCVTYFMFKWLALCILYFICFVLLICQMSLHVRYMNSFITLSCKFEKYIIILCNYSVNLFCSIVGSMMTSCYITILVLGWLHIVNNFEALIWIQIRIDVCVFDIFIWINYLRIVAQCLLEEAYIV